jgi:hypothetical protein
MLSSDKNVETFAELIVVLKHYLGLQKEYLKLGLTDKVVTLLTAATLTVLLFVITSVVLLFFWLGVAHFLATYTGMATAMFIVAAIHLGILLLFVAFRKTWIERPLVHFLANLFLS